MKLTDSYGRQINYLRISVTDRCNYRCFYCMPEHGVCACQHEDLLSYDELIVLAETAVQMGIEKIRITGGEPLVRKGIIEFLARLSAIDGLKHLALSTNGQLLDEMAADLRLAGVQRFNISLDSLRPGRFAQITRGGDLKKVLRGLDRIAEVGFPLPKLNIVAMRGINDDEFLDFVDLTLTRGYSIRFIEYMPTLKEPGWQKRWIAGSEILNKIAANYPLEHVDKGPYAGPANDFRITGAKGTIGFITALSNHFCEQCNRIRVTSTGTAKSCLFSEETIDLRPNLTDGNRLLLRRQLNELVQSKPRCHSVTTGESDHSSFLMSQVGG
ncbi:MAG: GTP 3',8-cyclase MoaA [Desulfuromonas sp.]|nr:MAG: GTP 3',8-cyclase MoaA [Desulfuromonas sp.]